MFRFYAGLRQEDLCTPPLHMKQVCAGLRQGRVRGSAYDDFIDEIMTSLETQWPGLLIQFADFGNRSVAWRLGLSGFRG